MLGQFNLSTRAIGAAADEVRVTASTGDGPLARRLWDACRAQTRPRLDDLAHRIAPVATWDDLVLPAPQLQALREIAGHVRQRLLYERGGCQKPRAGSASPLFSGDSGTAKTMAAEVLANELRLDSHHIDPAPSSAASAKPEESAGLDAAGRRRGVVAMKPTRSLASGR